MMTSDLEITISENKAKNTLDSGFLSLINQKAERVIQVDTISPYSRLVMLSSVWSLQPAFRSGQQCTESEHASGS